MTSSKMVISRGLHVFSALQVDGAFISTSAQSPEFAGKFTENIAFWRIKTTGISPFYCSTRSIERHCYIFEGMEVRKASNICSDFKVIHGHCY